MKNKVVEITIYEKPDDGDDEIYYGGASNGYVDTMEDAGGLVNLITQGKMDGALGMLERLRFW